MVRRWREENALESSRSIQEEESSWIHFSTICENWRTEKCQECLLAWAARYLILLIRKRRTRKWETEMGQGWGSESHSVVSDSLWPHGLYSPWNFPGQNTGVGSLSLLQGIFPTQGSNPGLPHCRQILHQLSHQESPRILEWVAYPFSSGFSQSRNWIGVSYITGALFLPAELPGKPEYV